MGNAIGLGANQFHRGAIGEQTHIGQGHAPTCFNRLDHGVGVVHLHANHLDFGAYGLDVIGNARYQAAAANRHKHGIKRALVLAQHLHGHRALPCDHIGVVEGVNKCETFFSFKLNGMVVGI